MSNWLDNVPVSEVAYAFQGALLCVDCGRAAAESLLAKGVADDGDSGTFPQGPYPDGGGEADSAQFCGQGRHCLRAAEIDGHKVGCPLLCYLTSDGVDAVYETVKRCIVSPRNYDQKLGRLLNRVWGANFDGRLGRVALPASLPSLEKLVGKKYVLHHVVLADPGNLYLLGIRAPGQTYHLLRAGVDDEGKFASLDVVDVPAELVHAEGVEVGQRKVVELSGVEKLLRQAAVEGAWD
jgi:hypothetical protein